MGSIPTLGSAPGSIDFEFGGGLGPRRSRPVLTRPEAFAERISADTYSQAARYLQFANTRIALIIYLNDASVGRPRVTAPIFAISLRTLLSKMAEQSFAEVVISELVYFIHKLRERGRDFGIYVLPTE